MLFRSVHGVSGVRVLRRADGHALQTPRALGRADLHQSTGKADGQALAYLAQSMHVLSVRVMRNGLSQVAEEVEQLQNALRNKSDITRNAVNRKKPAG